MIDVAIISPHLDDAIFSVAEHMLSRPRLRYAIVTPFAAIPPDDAGRQKYEVLLEEHDEVCLRLLMRGLDVQSINGPFLDDAVVGRWVEVQAISDWLEPIMREVGEFWVPLGIHHPDHAATRAAVEHVNRRTHAAVGGTSYYEELPYRVLYPGAKPPPTHTDLLGYDPGYLTTKKELCRMYASQMKDPADLERCLYVPERMWGAR